MKRKIFILLMALFTMSNLSIGKTILSKEDDETPVILQKQDSEDPNKNEERTSSFVPLTCYYELGCIYLTALADLGVLEVTVTNLSTNEVWTSTESSTNGVMCLPTSASSGNYMVQIITEFGDVYEGYYQL